MNKVEWTLPGTVLSVDADRPQAAEEVFSSLFLAGGLVLSQVTQVTGLEPYIIQNWVRRGFLAPPKQRKYTRRQLDKIAKLPEDSEEFVRFWEKQYRGWELVECEKSFNEQTGWYFYLTMRRAHIKQNGGLK